MALWNWGEEAGSGRISSNSSCMRLQPRSFTQCHRNPAKERGREGSQLPGHAARRRHRHPQNARSSLKYVGRFALPHGVLCACREGACVSGRGAARTHMRVRQPAHPVKPFKPGVLHQGGCAPLPAQPVTRVTHQAGRGGACQWLQPTVRCSLGALPWKPNPSPPPPPPVWGRRCCCPLARGGAPRNEVNAGPAQLPQHVFGEGQGPAPPHDLCPCGALQSGAWAAGRWWRMDRTLRQVEAASSA